MKCAKCEYENREGALFCGNCGAELSQNEKVEKKRLSLKKKIIIGVVSFLVAFAVVGVVWGKEIVNKLMFAMPAETQLQSAYYNLAEKIGKESGILFDEYKKTLSLDSFSNSGTIGIRLSDTVKAMLGIDIEEIESIYLDYEMIQEDYDYGINLDLGLGENHIVSLESVVDYEEGTVTMLFPELSAEAIVADMEYDLGIDMSGMEDFSTQVDMATGMLTTIIPEGEIIEELFPTYVKTIIKAIDKVERKEGTLKAGGLSQEATALIVNFDEDMVEKISNALYKELKNDDSFKKYMRGIYEISMEMRGTEVDEDTWNQEYDELLSEIKTALSQLKDEEIFQEGVKFVTWIDSDNQIIGIELAETIAWKSVEDGNKVATEIAFVDYGTEMLKIVVEGKESNDIFEGDVTIYAEGTEFITIEVAEFKNTEDEFLCVAEVVLDDELMENMTGEPWLAGDITIQLDSAGTKEETGMEIALQLGGNELAAIEFTSNGLKENVSIERPINVTDYSNIDAWVMNIDVSTILNNLEKAGFSELDILGYMYEYGL